jgi:hypothetical protein
LARQGAAIQHRKARPDDNFHILLHPTRQSALKTAQIRVRPLVLPAVIFQMAKSLRLCGFVGLVKKNRI